MHVLGGERHLQLFLSETFSVLYSAAFAGLDNILSSSSHLLLSAVGHLLSRLWRSFLWLRGSAHSQ